MIEASSSFDMSRKLSRKKGVCSTSEQPAAVAAAAQPATAQRKSRRVRSVVIGCSPGGRAAAWARSA
jgi:cysteine synthase